MKATALLIDDDPVDLKAMDLLVRSWDFNTLPVRSGQDALASLGREPIDLVISDVCMPGMSGEEVVRRIADLSPGLPVVLITGQGDVRSAVNAMKLGAFDYVLKPPDPDEFRLTAERALEHARLRSENRFLRSELSIGGMYGERLIGRSPGMQAVFDLINRVARTDTTILITGETGTGKELVAQTLHCKSDRADRPLVALNCAALNPNLIESELFGHERGAFTGAVSTRRGRFEDANGGTLLLDEIGETAPEFQAKLLRVLQEGSFERVGGSDSMAVDVRVLASTNRDLEADVRSGRFREDLYYRLSVIPIHVPALRERREDIPLLAAHFVRVYAERYGSPVETISPEGLEALAAREWRGNVRELQHAVERAVVLATSATLQAEDFRTPMQLPHSEGEDSTLRGHLEARTREHLVRVLDSVGWRKGQAASVLDVDRATLYRLLKKHSLDRR